MKEYQSPYKNINGRKFNTWCKYQKRIDTYGLGCQHGCHYCYAKGLLEFRKHWNENPLPANLSAIHHQIKKLNRNDVVKLGSMTDCFQPMELGHRVTFKTIQLLNHYKINYLIVTKSDNIARDEYLKIYDKNLAHFQITITNTSDIDCLKYENAPKISKRIKAIELLASLDFDVSIRLSPLIDKFINYDILNSIQCDKILIEFLKVNHFIKKWFNIDYSHLSSYSRAS